MQPPQQELQAIGRTVAGAFKRLVEAPWTADEDTAIPSRRRILAEEERFQLWARTLGLFQTGHASLDYRARDAPFIQASLVDLLTELQDHLDNLLAIALGTRLPLERDEEARRAAETEHESTSSDDEASLGSSLGSVGSFQEAEFRLSSIASGLDSLYKLASRIRSPRNRQQRSIKDLYKQIPESRRAEYIQEQEHVEVSLVAYVQRQQLMESVDDNEESPQQQQGLGREELLAEYASTRHWLIARVGKANARRKQQFLYWKKHAEVLGRDVTEESPAVAELPAESVTHVQPAVAPTQTSEPGPVKSIATSVTKMDLNAIGPEDMNSVISTRSRVSTVVSPRGENLVWPSAPSHLAGHKYFQCPYCYILCPERYLSGDDWRVHQIHDLQPYLCTYEDCPDPDRLYGVKQEWIDHENQHRRVWHCHSHEAEFETQPEYLQHLREQHPEEYNAYTSEMIAAAVGASAKPHRDCPFCPTTFCDVRMMQNHVRYHLERLALYALPDIEDGMDDELASATSLDSPRVIGKRGREASIGKDFAQGRQAFQADIAEDDVGRYEPPARRGDGTLLTTAILHQIPTSSPGSSLDAYFATPHTDYIYPPPKNLRIPKKLWEAYRPIIEELYLSTPLSEVPRIMAEDHGFQAEKRQYVYRLEKWKVRKYNYAMQTAEHSSQEYANDDDDEDADTDNHGLATPAIHVDDAPSTFSSHDPTSLLNPRSYEDYSIAVVCAMGFEVDAVRLMLSNEHPGLRPKPGDMNLYKLGDLYGHNVVLACLPGQQGKGAAAAAAAANIPRTFPSIKLRLLVGVGAGVPDKHDIRLGDVVVSMAEGANSGVVQYDLGKTNDNGFQRKSFLRPPPTLLRNAVETMRDRLVADNWMDYLVTSMLKKSPELGVYRRPSPEADLLFPRDYPHHSGSALCAVGCARSRAVDRPARKHSEVHYGLIASGNFVIKSAVFRSEAARSLGDVLCFETEAAGLASEFPCVVIRGISDYADSHKNDVWLHFAAAAAAACAREIISYLDPKDLL